MLNSRIAFVHAVAAVLALVACQPCLGEADKEDSPPKDLPDLAASAKLAGKMPKTIAGVVFLDSNANGRPEDGEGLQGVRVTDGVHFVRTGKDGRYNITIKPAPLIPYLPSRTVSVCWPSGTWPAQIGKNGRWRWWARLKDIEDPKQVNFRLLPRADRGSLCVTFGTDPHDAFGRAQNNVWRDEVARAGRHVDFAVAGGDLGYLGFGNADRDYTAIEQFTNQFPVPMFHCIGNHDVVAVHTKWWRVPHELAGNGAFTKYLGPIRWSFDCEGVHFVGMDWSVIDSAGKIQGGVSDSAIDWLEADLKAVAKGTPKYFFNHQAWSPNKRFFDVLGRYGVKLCLGGHSHRNMFLGRPHGVEVWTKMSLYTLVYIDKDGSEFVDRCIYRGGRNGWDEQWHHNRRGCALYTNPEEEKAQRGKHTGLKDVRLTNGIKTLPPPDSATYDLRLGMRPTRDKGAQRIGLRIVDPQGKVYEIAYDTARKMLTMLGRETFFDPVLLHPQTVRNGKATTDPAEQKWIEMRIYVMPDRVRLIVNNRLHYQKFIKAGPAKKLEIFSEGGDAEIGRFDLWPRTWPKDWNPRATANTG